MSSSSERITDNYQGFIDPKAISNHEQHLMDMASGANIHPVKFFSIKYRVLPCTITVNTYQHRHNNNNAAPVLHTSR